jgi:ABC-type transport system involved in Fe-S cluster assembly fused permease/ATPase subunit
VDFDGTLPVEDTGAYIMKADKYKDLAGTVGIFLLFGVGGLIFVLLNMAGVLTVLNGWMPNMIMLAMFLFFIYVAISTNSKAKKVKAEIEAETKLTQEINEWFQANFTEEFLASIHNDNYSEELNYIKMTDRIKELLLKEFGPQNLAYLDRLIDEYYNSHFE